MKDTLVVYFSRSGNTRHVAEMLAKELSADLDEIREAGERRGILGFLRSGYEAVKGIAPAIFESARKPGDYARVLVGTPVWAGHVASPVRAYLELHRDELRHVAFFCTYGGRGAVGAFSDMAQLVGQPPEGTLAVSEREVALERDAGREHFIKELRAHPL